MTRLQQLTYMAVAKMNGGLAPRDYEARRIFELDLTPGFEGFAIKYGEQTFLSSDELQEPEEENEELASAALQAIIVDYWVNRVQVPIGRINATEDYRDLSPETRKLIDSVDMFAIALRHRLIKKGAEGYTGWEGIPTPTIIKEVKARVARWEKREAGLDVGIAAWCLINFANRSQGELELPATLADSFAEEPEVIEAEKSVPTHYFKGNPYRLMAYTEIKLSGVLYMIDVMLNKTLLSKEDRSKIENAWLPVAIYTPLYGDKVNVPFVREANQFNEMFLATEVVNSEKESTDIVEQTVKENKKATNVGTQMEKIVTELVDDEEEEETETTMELIDDEQDSETLNQFKNDLSKDVSSLQESTRTGDSNNDSNIS